jgi:anti-sigma regulatory factor (Ser/Thr protein kinase)
VTDEITLTMPAGRPFHRVAHLVFGGLAVRLDLTYDILEDLQLALDELLERAEDDSVTVVVRVDGDALRTSIGPYAGDRLRHELEQEVSESMTLRRLLETVADEVEIARRDGGDYVELTKMLGSRPEAA